VRGVLSRLHEYADPDRLASATGTVRIDLTRDDARLGHHLLRLVPGAIEVEVDVPASAPADVVLGTSVVGFIRLVSGQGDAALDYLAGRLHVQGDAALALTVGGLFTIPGTDAVAVDPTALDPVDVARALAGVPISHLREVMSGGFRPVVLDEIFRRLPDFVNPRRAARSDLVVGFRLTGGHGPEPDRYVVTVDHGACKVEPGDVGGHRDATITCEGYDFLRLATGHLSAVTGVLRGQLKVKGDKAKALQLASVLDIPQA
jgi:putative sterol carrier protein